MKHLTADVLVVRPLSAGEPAGYYATPAPADGWAVVVARPGDRLPAIWKELGTTTATRRDFVAEAREAEEGPAA